MNEYPLRNETGLMISIALEIHRTLGKGFLEIVYKDALAYELAGRAIGFEREKAYEVQYKSIILRHRFYADFVVEPGIIGEVNAKEGFAEVGYAQTINYLRVSGCKVGLVFNFGERSLQIKRVVL